MAEPQAFNLEDLVASLACSLPHVQQRLDEEWKDSVIQYLKALEAPAGEWRALAEATAPARQVVVESEMTAEFRFHRARSEDARLSVSLINLGFERKFAHSAFVRHTLTMKVVTHPLHEERLRG